jgi:hypothetical protein
MLLIPPGDDRLVGDVMMAGKDPERHPLPLPIAARDDQHGRPEGKEQNQPATGGKVAKPLG